MGTELRHARCALERTAGRLFFSSVSEKSAKVTAIEQLTATSLLPHTLPTTPWQPGPHGIMSPFDLNPLHFFAIFVMIMLELVEPTPGNGRLWLRRMLTEKGITQVSLDGAVTTLYNRVNTATKGDSSFRKQRNKLRRRVRRLIAEKTHAAGESLALFVCWWAFATDVATPFLSFLLSTSLHSTHNTQQRRASS